MCYTELLALEIVSLEHAEKGSIRDLLRLSHPDL